MFAPYGRRGSFVPPCSEHYLSSASPLDVFEINLVDESAVATRHLVTTFHRTDPFARFWFLVINLRIPFLVLFPAFLLAVNYS
jgi:hypothetical protein